MAKATGLVHHIEIYVSDLNKSKIFWSQLLESMNYKKFQDWAGGISWKLKDHYIVFVQTKEKYLDVTYNRCRVGLNHLAFHVESKEKLDELADKIIKNGSLLLYNDKFRKDGSSDIYSVFFEDPDRIKVELVYSE